MIKVISLFIKKYTVVFFIVLLSMLLASRNVYADIAGGSFILVGLISVVIIIGIAIAVIWGVSYLVIKYIGMKNDNIKK